MPFATADDVAARLGRNLTDAETTASENLIGTVQALIIDAVDRDSEWADALDPVPGVLKGIVVEKVCGALANPQGIQSMQETLGQHSYAVRFGQGGSSLWLTPQEERLARSAVYGTLTGSSTPRALNDRLIDLNEGRDVDEPEVPA